jgi:hypothetical protein
MSMFRTASSVDAERALSATEVGIRTAAWFAVVPVILLHVYLRDEAFDIEAGVCAGLMASLALLALAHTRPRTLPALAVVLLRLYIAGGAAIFRAPMLSGSRGPIHLSHQGLSQAMLGILVFGVLAAAATPLGKPMGALLRPRLRWMTEPRVGHSLAERSAVRVVALSSVAIHTTFTALGKPLEFGAAAHVATILLTAPLPLTLLWFDMTRAPTMWSRWLVYGSAMIYTLAGLGTGMLSDAIEPIAVVLVLRWSLTGRVPWVTVFAALALALLLNGAKHRYRTMVWYAPAGVGALERAEMWATALEQVYGGPNVEEAAINSADSVAARLQTVPQIAQVMDWVPSVVPHAGPELWLKLPLEFMPRVLWKDKPVHMVEYNRRYALTFGIQHDRTRSTTSIALPPIADGYWRLGWTGVAIEGLLLGLVIGFYTSLFDVRSTAAAAIGTAFIAGGSAEHHVFHILAGQPQAIIAIAAAVALTRQLGLLLVRQNSGLVATEETT